MPAISPTPAERARGAAAALAVSLGLGAALIAGLGVDARRIVERAPVVFGIAPPPEPEPVPETRATPKRERRPLPKRATAPRPEGAASPANLRGKASAIVAPPVPIVVQPLLAVEVAGIGSQRTTGAAPVAGPGTGSGGIGTGTGSGAGGDGDGGGGGGEGETPPRWRSGGFRDGDYPAALYDAGIGGTVGVRYVVETDGRVGDCRVTRSSGHAELDAITCRTIQRRFRFHPSRDVEGRAVASTIVENHSWIPHPEGEDDR
ncbi:energy transducer TonB [Sphingomonas sp. ac-8]|uniref:energy transducer TonB n=1 Tax=Sphingomonas sp. ac-8 TaxID=3242977 RepID=UPI003A8054D1